MNAPIAAPSAWVARFVTCIPAGRVLDLACGTGRHARLLAAAGFAVLAVDRDQAALDALDGHRIETLCVDLEAADAVLGTWLRPQAFAGIVVTNYLHRPLLPLLFDSLIEGGVLIYETFAAGNALFGKPSNPDFLLQPAELLQATAAAPCHMHVLAFEDGRVSQPKPAMLQRLCAIRGALTPSSGGGHL
ncbi:SAM-dependent methyltransferase [Actimicrobium sp. GrIS 1.19]|uniref:class I SAM-dependent methyltransferase n=1 Tax=Actimicrobium sp. GrIS 1.19 TaxID=3071708 RepID=UPI002E08B512|nr:SAM-dependent methyltransferase [Actimicrobium sp. GrIS 1.19]